MQEEAGVEVGVGVEVVNNMLTIRMILKVVKLPGEEDNQAKEVVKVVVEKEVVEVVEAVGNEQESQLKNLTTQ